MINFIYVLLMSVFLGTTFFFVYFPKKLMFTNQQSELKKWVTTCNFTELYIFRSIEILPLVFSLKMIKSIHQNKSNNLYSNIMENIKVFSFLLMIYRKENSIHYKLYLNCSEKNYMFSISESNLKKQDGETRKRRNE